MGVACFSRRDVCGRRRHRHHACGRADLADRHRHGARRAHGGAVAAGAGRGRCRSRRAAADAVLAAAAVHRGARHGGADPGQPFALLWLLRGGVAQRGVRGQHRCGAMGARRHCGNPAVRIAGPVSGLADGAATDDDRRGWRRPALEPDGARASGATAAGVATAARAVVRRNASWRCDLSRAACAAGLFGARAGLSVDGARSRQRRRHESGGCALWRVRCRRLCGDGVNGGGGRRWRVRRPAS